MVHRGLADVSQDLVGVSQFLQHTDTSQEVSWEHFNREFKIEYQPVMALSGGQMVGIEALLNWQEQRGQFYSAEGLSLLEETGLSLPLRGWLLKNIIKQLYFWNRQFLSAASLSVTLKLSKKQWLSPGLIETFRKVTQELNWPIRGLILEIAYPVLIQHLERLSILIPEVQKLGITVQVSRVLPTHSTLAALQYFGITAIKVEQTFIRNLVLSHGTLGCFKQVLQELQRSNTAITIPCIENPEQVNLLSQFRGSHWNAVCAIPLSAKETTLLINADSRIAQSSVTTYLSAMNRLSQFVQFFLGEAVVRRYWQSTQPASDWLAADQIAWQTTGLLSSAHEFSLSEQQIQDLECWVQQFMGRCSQIIRDLPGLVRYSGLTLAETELLRLAHHS